MLWCTVGLTTVTVFWPVSQSTVLTNFNWCLVLLLDLFCIYQAGRMSVRSSVDKCTGCHSRKECNSSCAVFSTSAFINWHQFTWGELCMPVSTHPGRSHLHSAAIGDLLVPTIRPTTVAKNFRDGSAIRK